jgi:Double zinc ribbon
METILISCKSCGGESPSDARFCIECGESLHSATGPTTLLATPTCAACGSENLPDARFCGICGRAMLAGPTAGASPWVQPQVPQQPRLRPYAAPAPRPAPMPIAPPAPIQPVAPPQSFPRPVAAHRQYRVGRHNGFSPAVLIAMVGFGALFVLKAMSWPLVLLVVGAVFIVHQAEHGRLNQALRTAAIAGSVLFVASNPRFWPVLLIAFGLFKLLGGRRVF